MKRFQQLVVLSAIVFGAVGALAADAQGAGAGASAEVKVGTGVENREVVGEADRFALGSEVWLWSRVRGAEGTAVTHVWKRDGVEVWRTALDIGGKRWTTYSHFKVRAAGAYTVEVVAADGAVLGTVPFAVP